MKNRLVHVFNSTLVSGPETLVIPALSKLSVPVTVVFICELRKKDESNRPPAYARSFGLSVRVVWVSSRYDKDAIRQLSLLFSELQADIIHAHDVKASTYTLAASRLCARTVKKSWKLVSTHHGVRARKGFRIKLYEWYYVRFVLPWFDSVLVVCTSDKELLILRGLSPDRITVHLNGIDRIEVPLDRRTEKMQQIRERWNIPQGPESANDLSQRLLIGFVGRLAREKRLDLILRICANLNRTYPDMDPWNLVIFGTGSLEQELKNQAQLHALQNRVIWMGYRGNIGNEFAGFDVVISMSEYEGLPINLIEAGWGATPIVATRIDGNLDLIPDDSLGVLVDIADTDETITKKLYNLLTNISRRRAMGAAFQKHVKNHFSGQRWLSDLVDIYENIAVQTITNRGAHL